MSGPLNPTPENILVRAPNWLGDTLMSAGFFHKLAQVFPDSAIDAVVDAKLAGIVRLIPVVRHVYGYPRHAGVGLKGLYRFCREIAGKKRYDLYFSLPDSFSAALMGFCTRSRHRIGFRNDMRSFLLTHAFSKPGGLHRVEEYTLLLHPFVREPLGDIDLSLDRPPADAASPVVFASRKPVFIYHMNSEARSRRVPVEKAAAIAETLIAALECHLVLTGTAGDAGYNDALASRIARPDHVTDLAGKTSLYALADLMIRADLVISTDSGTAHLANSLGAALLVLWGPADATNTAPYGKGRMRLVRHEGLPCMPCVKNVCRFGTNQCYLDIDNQTVLDTVRELLAERAR